MGLIPQENHYGRQRQTKRHISELSASLRSGNQVETCNQTGDSIMTAELHGAFHGNAPIVGAETYRTNDHTRFAKRRKGLWWQVPANKLIAHHPGLRRSGFDLSCRARKSLSTTSDLGGGADEIEQNSWCNSAKQRNDSSANCTARSMSAFLIRYEAPGRLWAMASLLCLRLL